MRPYEFVDSFLPSAHVYMARPCIAGQYIIARPRDVSCMVIVNMLLHNIYYLIGLPARAKSAFHT